jgi:hypothetical protein
MPGRTPHEAFSAFVTPLADALKCVADPIVTYSAGGSTVPDVKHNLYLTRRGVDSDDYLRLGGGVLELAPVCST